MKTLIFGLLLILITKSANAQWSIINSSTNNNLKGVYFIDDNIGFVSGDSGTLLKTMNSGNTWIDIYTINSDNLKKSYAISKDTVYTGYNNLYSTTDGGFDWTKIASSTIYQTFQFTDIYFKSHLKGFVNTPWELWKYESPYSWTQVIEGSIKKLQFINDTGYIIGVQHPGSSLYEGLYKTINGGDNWTFLQPQDSIKISSYYFINNLIGYIITDNQKLYKTLDGGNSCTLINNSISSDSITDCIFLNENIGYVTTVSGKILITNNGGILWNIDYAGINRLNSIYITQNYIGFVVGDNGVILKKHSALSVIDINKNRDFQIYPNPANNNLTVICSSSKQSEISIFNLQGQLILSQPLKLQKTIIYISTLAQGMYFVKVQTEKGVEVKKIIKE